MAEGQKLKNYWKRRGEDEGEDENIMKKGKN